MTGAFPSVNSFNRGRKSLVAEHPDRAAIEIGLANNVGLKTLAKRYGIEQSVLSRYRAKMPDELLMRLRVRGVKSDEELGRIREVESNNLLDHLAYQRGRLYVVADTCAKLGDPQGERAALDAAGKASERIAKLLGEMGGVVKHEHRHVHLAALPEYHVLRANLVRALRPFPADVHAAAVEAFRQTEVSIAQVPALIEGEVSKVDAKLEAVASE